MPSPRRRALIRVLPAFALGALFPAVAPPAPLAAQAAPTWEALASRAEITRTTRGIPHIRAEDTAAAGFALGWVQMEDYGIRVVDLLLSARGETARHYGPGDDDARIRGDLRARRTLRIAEEKFPSLPADLRGMYEGFALAVNRWLELHPEDAPPSLHPDFRGYQVLARDVPGPDWGMGDRFVRSLSDADAAGSAAGGAWSDAALALAPSPDPETLLAGYEAGSNTWALAPERTTSGHAILMRNPHLSWTSGYYEGHMTIEGDLEFYGDFRIGGPFSVIGGWNARLGWSTTNNNPELSDLYALAPDPARPGHVLWDGGSVPLEVHAYEVEVWNGDRLDVRSQEIAESPLGPVVHTTPDAVYVVRTAGDGEPRLGEQFLAMMRAGSLAEWKDAMRMQARTQSNFTYADADGNIFYVWNAMHPDRPHAWGADTLAHRAAGPTDAWQGFLAFDELPQVENPPGGYLRNENDPFHHTNLNAVLEAADYPPEAEAPRVRLRSQHSLELLHNDARFSLEEVVALKGSERMLLADRVLDDLLAALRGARGGGTPGWSAAHDQALSTLEGWDRTVAAEARGAVLFTEWWERYLASAGRAPSSAASVGFPARAEDLFAEPWRMDAPMTTPRGLASGARAVEAFMAAVPATRARWGATDVAWGAVHRARHGTLDLPVGGCDGLLGCFRVLWFTDDDDGRRRVRGGDGWVSAVEFGPVPRAYTVLAYGQSARPGSPFHQDQLADFVAGRMTPVAWRAEDIAAETLVRYRPGRAR
jgi:acyl-homoserine-lactone acylase